MLFVLKYLLAHPCEDCGETDPRVLEFDHVGRKTFTIGDALTRSKLSLEVLREEINHCIVRCANCHRRKHAKHSYKAMTVEQLQKEIDRKTAYVLGVPNGVPSDGASGQPQEDPSSVRSQSEQEEAWNIDPPARP